MYVRYVDPLSLQAFCRCWWECEEKGQNFDRVYYRQNRLEIVKRIKICKDYLVALDTQRAETEAWEPRSNRIAPTYQLTYPTTYILHTWFIFVRSYPGYSWH